MSLIQAQAQVGSARVAVRRWAVQQTGSGRTRDGLHAPHTGAGAGGPFNLTQTLIRLGQCWGEAQHGLQEPHAGAGADGLKVWGPLLCMPLLMAVGCASARALLWRPPSRAPSCPIPRRPRRRLMPRTASTTRTHTRPACTWPAVQDPHWGAHARAIAQGTMWQQPRGGGHDDKAHPPIHPVKYSAGVFGPCVGKNGLRTFVYHGSLRHPGSAFR